MKPGTFIVNGVSSEDHKFYIQSRPDIMSPKRRVLLETSFGRDGSIPFDEGAYDNTSSEWSIVLDGSVKNRHENREILFSMFDSGSYVEIQHYYDEDKLYYGMLSDSITYVNKGILGEHQIATVPLTLKPFKFLVDSPKIVVVKGDDIMNPTRYNSLPKIKLVGNGDCVITIGTQTFSITNIQGHIFIDSELEYLYKESGNIVINENSKARSRDYPVLRQGMNSITWTGTFTVEIEPRWRALV